MATEGDRLKDLILLARQVQWQYQIEDYTNATLKQIIPALDQARNEIMQELYRKEGLVTDTRAEALLDELRSLTLGIQMQLGDDVEAAATVVAEKSLSEYGKILSFDGAVAETVGFNFVSLSSEQLRAIVVSTPIGGRLMSEWVEMAFEKHLQEDIKRELLAGYFKGESTKKLVDRIRDGFGGTERDMISLVRTTIAEANNRAAEAVYKANSDIIKRVEWSATLEISTKSGFGTCPRCLALDGQSWKLGEAHPPIPLHPRCVTSDSIIFAPDVTHLTKSNYSGPIIKLTFSDGTGVSITPNHMLMGPDGLIMARFLAEGDHLLSCSDFKGVIFGDPNDDRNDLRIDNIVKSFSESGGVRTGSMPMSPEYFHGDGIFGDKNVDVVNAESLLVNGVNTKFIECFTRNALSSINFASFLSSYSSIALFFKRHLSASHDRVGFSREFFAFVQWCLRHSEKHSFTPVHSLDTIVFEKFMNWRSAYTEFFGDSFYGISAIEEGENFFKVNIKSCMMNIRSKIKAGINKSAFDSISLRDSSNSCDFRKTFPRHIESVKIIDVKFVHVNNLPVYDVSTLSSGYIVNGILSSNCRCNLLPKTVTYRELGLDIDELREAARPYTIRKGIPVGTGRRRTILEVGRFQGKGSEFVKSKGDKYILNVLGPGRKALYDAGKIDFKDLVDKQGNLRLLKKNKDGDVVGLEK